MRGRPQDRAKGNDYGETQAIADVHRAEKVSRLAIEMQTTNRAAIIHLRNAPIKARAEDLSRPASWAKLSEDAAQRGWL